MPIEIEMPKLSDTMTEGTLVKWLKKEGDAVAVGDILAEVETDKATMEMEAFDDGVLHEIRVQDGQKVEVGSTIAILLEEGEEAPAPGSETRKEDAGASVKEGSKKQAEDPQVEKEEGKAKETLEKRDESRQPASASTESGGRVKASPLARKVAAELGVDLSSVSGSGPGGRVVEADVRGAGKEGSAKPAAAKSAPAASAPADLSAAGESETIALTGMRRVIAQRLLESKTQIPHFYLFAEVDAGELMKFRKRVNESAEASGEPKITVNDFVLKAAVVAAQRNPKVNATFAGDSIVQFKDVNLSVAVAVDDGLVTPVIRDAGSKSLREISSAVKDLATRARSKKLKPEEYAGGTITVSNLGSYGVDSFSAIINPPQSLIISVGAIVKKPVVGANDQIVVGQRVIVGLSCDHRVVDGAIGAAYLAELKRLLESPAMMLL